MTTALLDEYAAISRDRFFSWIAQVCKELGWDVSRGSELISDPNWFLCYDDKISPAEAIAEAKANGVV